LSARNQVIIWILLLCLLHDPLLQDDQGNTQLLPLARMRKVQSGKTPLFDEAIDQIFAYTEQLCRLLNG
jgi:hypothetical protein